MVSWEDQYLVDFPIVTINTRVFKVPCSLTVMKNLLTDETGDKMDRMFQSFFANIEMKQPDKYLLAMEFYCTSFLDSLLKIPFPSTCGRWFIVDVQKDYLRKDMQDKKRWMTFIKFTFDSIQKALSKESSTGVKQMLLKQEIVNPALIGTNIEREHSYAKHYTEDPADTSYLFEDE